MLYNGASDVLLPFSIGTNLIVYSLEGEIITWSVNSPAGLDATGRDLVSLSDHSIDCLIFIGLYVLQGQHTARDGLTG